MVSKIEPDRYANTGFSVKDTSPEINEILFQRMMALTPGERLVMGMSMTATARAMVWAGISDTLTPAQRRREFCLRFYGEDLLLGRE